MSNDGEKKIFIDEDWKAQVQREKEEALRKKQEAALNGNDLEAPTAEVPESNDENPEIDASFANLISSLATQAMFALGVIAPQGSKQVSVNLDQAQFFLDTLAMLQEKTKGNLTNDEAKHLEEALHELSHVFNVRMQQVEEQAMHNANADLNNLKNPNL